MNINQINCTFFKSEKRSAENDGVKKGEKEEEEEEEDEEEDEEEEEEEEEEEGGAGGGPKGRGELKSRPVDMDDANHPTVAFQSLTFTKRSQKGIKSLMLPS
ncbi:hypothetical protein ElyMa_004023100 [Elysia marginata]|uniref:Uncharacterized protein n=1 Tax=Elysia marginata TaxID=1093978 RepID=A0AAV4G3L0_9GAST|nr:hypothetical protein ElyMa_004023100 [Elysia marginata]